MNWKRLAAVLAPLLCLAGCGSSSTKTTGAKVEIAFLSSPLPTTIRVGDTASISAKVNNDSSNAGVSWSCSPAATCGSFSPNPTTNLFATTYTAPATAPAGPVTITASSVTDSSATVSFSLTVTAFPVSITFDTSQLSAFLTTGSTISIQANVTNDNSNSGVSWSCTPTPNCGNFSPNPSASGDFVTFTAPSTSPSNGKITLIASAVADPNARVGRTFVVSGSASSASLNGQYAYSLSAPNGNLGSTSLLGSLSLDGNGNVTGGVQDLISPSLTKLNDPIVPTCASSAPSAYVIDSKGHGQMRICTASGQQFTFSFYLTSSSHALIIENDGNPASGSVDLQNPTSTGFSSSQISGGYSFTLTGTNAGSPDSKLSVGGEFTSDGVGNLSLGVVDTNSNGIFLSTPSVFGEYTHPDSNGRGTLTLSPVGQSFIYYIISSKALRIAEADKVALLGGSAFAQGPLLTPLFGPYVYEHSGWTLNSANEAGGQTVDAGLFRIDSGNQILFSASDSSAAGVPIVFNTRVPVKVSYSIFADSQTGQMTLTEAAGVSNFNFYAVDPALNILDPNTPPTAGGGLLLLHTDSSINGTGILMPQNPTTLLGNQVLNVSSLWDRRVNGQNTQGDFVGLAQVTSIPQVRLDSGIADYDRLSANPVIGFAFSSSGPVDPGIPGRYSPGPLLPPFGTSAPYTFLPAGNDASTWILYQINDTQSFVVSNDTSGVVRGTLQLQTLP